MLIACEGSKTEPTYFNAIRVALRLPAVQVIVVPHQGTDPRTVVRAAVEARNGLRREERWTTDDSAWAVFDGEEHREHNPANWNDALQIANNNRIRLAVSNPCFELWYLLHFQDQAAYLNRHKVRDLLKNYVPDYEKASRLFPEPLQNATHEAVRRAQNLEERAQTAGRPPHSNPCTSVHHLVQTLLDLSR